MEVYSHSVAEACYFPSHCGGDCNPILKRPSTPYYLLCNYDSTASEFSCLLITTLQVIHSLLLVLIQNLLYQCQAASSTFPPAPPHPPQPCFLASPQGQMMVLPAGDVMLHNAVELSRMIRQPFFLHRRDVPSIVDLLGSAVLNMTVPTLIAQLSVQFRRGFAATRRLSDDLTPELEAIDILPKLWAQGSLLPISFISLNHSVFQGVTFHTHILSVPTICNNRHILQFQAWRQRSAIQQEIHLVAV